MGLREGEGGSRGGRRQGKGRSTTSAVKEGEREDE